MAWLSNSLKNQKSDMPPFFLQLLFSFLSQIFKVALSNFAQGVIWFAHQSGSHSSYEVNEDDMWLACYCRLFFGGEEYCDSCYLG